MLKLKHAYRTAVAFLRHLVLAFFETGCQKSAAALTYMTLFAIVPLMTVMYSVFSIIPAFTGVGEGLQATLFSHFVPEAGLELQAYLTDFSSQARSLSGVGVLMLVVTAYFMLTNIEKTFNYIWGVHKPRRGLSSFLLYWAVLSIGPLLLGAGLAINTYLLSLKYLLNTYDTLGISAFLFRALPFVMTSSAFTLLFVAVPNCRVPFRYGVIGGVVTAACFELLKTAFSALVANSSFQLVYGAFAVVPLFLLWVNLVWMVILAGAIFVRTLAEREYGIEGGKVTDMAAALLCLALFKKVNETGGRVSDADCYRLGLGVVHWQFLRGQFIKHQWLATTNGGHYVLCRDLRKVTLWDLAELVQLELPDLYETIARPPDTAWFHAYMQRREAVTSHLKEAFDVSLEDLFNSKED